jgi:hypothetical protein
MTSIHLDHITPRTIKVFLTHKDRNKAASIHDYLSITIQPCQLVRLIFSWQLKFHYYLRRDQILIAPTIYDQTTDYIFDDACKVEDIATPPILIRITLWYQQTLSNHKGYNVISMQNTTFSIWITLIISKIHGLFLY